MCGRNDSLDASVPDILPPQVRVPSTPSMLLQFVVKLRYISNVNRTINRQKEAGFRPLLITELKLNDGI